LCTYQIFTDFQNKFYHFSKTAALPVQNKIHDAFGGNHFYPESKFIEGEADFKDASGRDEVIVP
jgi:hypothetical protein